MNLIMKMPAGLLAAVLTSAAVQGAVPAPEKLLPADTVAVFTVPDFTKAKASGKESCLGQLWNDPELKAFKEKFLAKWKTDLVEPLERELGIKFSDYTDLAQGQVTLALMKNSREGKADQKAGFVFLLDARDKADALKNNLNAIKKKWVDSGKQIKTEKIRDLEFTTLMITGDDLLKPLKKVFPQAAADADKGKDAKARGKTELIVGQSDSLLVVGTSAGDIEKILIRQSGGSMPALGEQPAYESNHNRLFRDALMFAWLNFQPVIDLLTRKAAGQNEPNESPRQPQLWASDKILAASGLKELRTLAFSVQTSADGAAANLFLSVPEADRRGIFKVINLQAKDASPPTFVPTEAAKFNRWRIDGQKAWAALEKMLADISPELSGLIQMMVNTVGKDKDPAFDFKKNFIGNVGDDFLSYQKNPPGEGLAAMNSRPSIFLIGSPRADQLALALKAASSLVPSEGGAVKEREFLGRRIYSLSLPPEARPEGGKPIERTLSFSASGGYLALTTDTALIEEYLRSGESKSKPLRDAPGLAEAAQKAGGMNVGFFAYENNNETARVLVEALKKDPALLGRALQPPIPGAPQVDSGEKTFQEWLDFSLLPPYDRIAKYFYFTVYAGTATTDGFLLTTFSPTPPKLRK
jgi:hypothetical protein